MLLFYIIIFWNLLVEKIFSEIYKEVMSAGRIEYYLFGRITDPYPTLGKGDDDDDDDDDILCLIVKKEVWFNS